MSERLDNDNFEQDRIPQPTIEELLPRYYEAHGDKLKFETVRSIPVDGHDIAWMKYEGETGNGRAFEGHILHCACEFTEDVGWKIDEEYGVVGLDGDKDCLPREAALFLRHRELRDEYVERFCKDEIFGDEFSLWDKIPEVMTDLIEKDKAGEFIGESKEGAHFWGGHYYMQTVNAITVMPYDKLWPEVNKLISDKKIQLEGMVIQEYRESPQPSWDEYGKFDIDSFTVVASIPSHSKMDQTWQYTILDEEGNVLEANLPGGRLMHSPDFGVDVDDSAQAEQEMIALIDTYKANHKTS